MGEAAIKQKRYTPTEYFEISSGAEYRLEYEEGQILNMGNTSDAHSELMINTASSLKQAVRGKGCKVYAETVSLEVAEGKKYYLPDVMLTCDARDHADRLMKRYPSLVAEVVSPSSTLRDREEKFAAYLKLSTIKYYLLIAQDQVRIEVFGKGTDKAWEFQYYEKMSEIIPLPHIGIELKVADIYEDVTLMNSSTDLS
ncbi:MAG: Uma2 family endonuclease [Bacteroidota bacterium]